MKIHRLYADKNGESHFQDVEIEYAESTRSGRLRSGCRRPASSFARSSPTTISTGIPRRGAIHHQSGRRSPDHGERWRSATHRRRRSPAGRGHARQGTSVEGARRQAAQLHLRDARVATTRAGARMSHTASTARRVVMRPRGPRARCSATRRVRTSAWWLAPALPATRRSLLAGSAPSAAVGHAERRLDQSSTSRRTATR